MAIGLRSIGESGDDGVVTKAQTSPGSVAKQATPSLEQTAKITSSSSAPSSGEDLIDDDGDASYQHYLPLKVPVLSIHA